MRILTGGGFLIPNYRCKNQGHLMAVAGFASSILSVLVAETFGMFGYPQISYGATDPLLSDTQKFPYFFRTVPSAIHLQNIVNLVLKYFGWKWVGILHSDSESNENAIQTIKASIIHGGGCIAFIKKFLSSTKYLNSEYVRIAHIITASSATVIVFWADLEFTYELYLLLHKLPISKKVWIFLTDMGHLLTPTIDNLDLSPFHGNLGIQLMKHEVPGLMEFLWNTTLEQYDNTNFIILFKSSMYHCNQHKGKVLYHTCRHDLEKKKKLMGAETLVESYCLYNAIYALAYALQDLLTSRYWLEKHRLGTSPALTNLKPWMLKFFLKRVNFTNTARELIYFDKYGDAAGDYDLVNWISNHKKKLRSLHVGKLTFTDIFVDESAVVWPVYFNQVLPRSVCSPSCGPGFRKTIQPGKEVCCYDCVPCPTGKITNQTDMIHCLKCHKEQWPNKNKDKCVQKQITYLSYQELLGGFLAISAVVLSVNSFFILAIFIHYKNTSVIKATNRKLSLVLLLSLTVTFSSCLVFIGIPRKITCMLRQPIFGMSFAVSVSSLLAKTILVVLAFHATKPGGQMRRFIGQKFPCLLVGLSSFLQALICAVWIGTGPPMPIHDFHSHPGYIIIECEERLGLYIMLAFIGCLALGCLVIAVLARNLPSAYNEAKYITFSMLVFFSVWVTFIPTYISTKGKYTIAVELFAILVSGAGVQVCIFFPKCYIIFCKPSKTRAAYIKSTNLKVPRKCISQRQQ
ncbi:vomeronasal type-2 receptor 26-like [Pyxicephalus adspersus]|uniref:vomeronasal type-2 receptor 26-like n=1 Tax=Pyxicephalus adspersus TaxID=30357 RepID=UPI003B5BC701